MTRRIYERGYFELLCSVVGFENQVAAVAVSVKLFDIWVRIIQTLRSVDLLVKSFEVGVWGSV